MPNKTMEQLSVELLQYLAERGNTTIARNNYRYILNPMTEYCKQNNNGYYSKECIERFLADHYGLQVERFETLRSHESHYHSKLRRICRMLEDLNQNRIPASRYPTSGIQLQTEAFVDILEKYRNHYQNYGYSPSSVNNYLQTARTFLEYCVEKEILHFSDMNREIVNGYILTLSGYKKSTIKNRLGGLRQFLKYLYTEEYATEDLSIDTVKLHVRSQIRIPSVWQREEVIKLLSVVDRGNPSGKRDYAMLLAVARLGIRVGDLCNLKFENIDWRNNKICFVQNKTHNPVTLPLLKDVGWAFIDYIKNGRPNVDTPHIFVTHVAPFKAFEQGNHHSKMIRKYMNFAHISGATTHKCGMHSLRHTLATTMLENHEDYHNITAILGHSSEDSASVYLKTSTELLRGCALEIPETCK